MRTWACVCMCACACAWALSWWTSQAKVWIWSLDYGSSVSWFTCCWCHPLAVHSVLRQREPPCSQRLEKPEAQKAFQYFNATRCEEQKTQTDAWSLRLSYHCHFFLNTKESILHFSSECVKVKDVGFCYSPPNPDPDLMKNLQPP